MACLASSYCFCSSGFSAVDASRAYAAPPVLPRGRNTEGLLGDPATRPGVRGGVLCAIAGRPAAMKRAMKRRIPDIDFICILLIFQHRRGRFLTLRLQAPKVAELKERAEFRSVRSQTSRSSEPQAPLLIFPQCNIEGKQRRRGRRSLFGGGLKVGFSFDGPRTLRVQVALKVCREQCALRGAAGGEVCRNSPGVYKKVPMCQGMVVGCLELMNQFFAFQGPRNGHGGYVVDGDCRIFPRAALAGFNGLTMRSPERQVTLKAEVARAARSAARAVIRHKCVVVKANSHSAPRPIDKGRGPDKPREDGPFPVAGGVVDAIRRGEVARIDLSKKGGAGAERKGTRKEENTELHSASQKHGAGLSASYDKFMNAASLILYQRRMQRSASGCEMVLADGSSGSGGGVRKICWRRQCRGRFEHGALQGR